eukprot:9351148-Pyramimonas_sp.AAC.1
MIWTWPFHPTSGGAWMCTRGALWRASKGQAWGAAQGGSRGIEMVNATLMTSISTSIERAALAAASTPADAAALGFLGANHLTTLKQQTRTVF